MSRVRGKPNTCHNDREGMGKRITDLRLALNLTQKDLGSMVGIHRVSIQLYENNKCTPCEENLQKLAIVLGTTSEYLETGDEKLKLPKGVFVPKQWNVLQHDACGRIYCPYCGKGNGFKVRELHYNQLPFPEYCTWCGRKVMT